MQTVAIGWAEAGGVGMIFWGDEAGFGCVDGGSVDGGDMAWHC